MEGDVVIRPSRPEDHDERMRLGEWCESTADAKIHGSGLLYWPDPNSPLLKVNLVAMVGDRMIGFIDGDQIMGPNEIGEVVALWPPEGYVHCIGVHPDYRRHGIGKRLLMAALQAYEQAGFVRAELCTPSPSAVIFFRSCGGSKCQGPTYPEDGNSFEWKFPLEAHLKQPEL